MQRDQMNVLLASTKVQLMGRLFCQRTSPKLGLIAGDNVVFIQEDNQVVVMNAAIYAMKKIQAEMAGEAKKANLQSEDDINDLLYEIRSEVESV